MGCISSTNKQLFSLKRDDVFNVCVMRVQSEDNRVILAGQGILEITPNEIIFIAPNQDPVAWALQHLRRYGLTENIFSFEAGRRCATGPGIYTFRCCNADQLYSKFQWYINSMSVGADRDRNVSSIHPSNLFERLDSHQQQHTNHYLEPTSLLGAAVEQRLTLGENAGFDLNTTGALISPSLTSEIIHIPSLTSYSNINTCNNSYNVYMDQPIPTSNEHNNNSSTAGACNFVNPGDLMLKAMIRTSSLDVPPDECAPILTPAVNDHQRMYSNTDALIMTQISAGQINNSCNDVSEPAYANVEVNHVGLSHVSQNNSLQHSSPERISSKQNGTVNYIVLDLDQPRSPSQCSPKTTFGSGQSLIASQGNVELFNVDETLTGALSLPCGSSTMPKRTTMNDARSKLSDTKIESSGSYSRIDFLKTFALMKSSTNYTDFDPDHDQEECRITRHSKFVRKAYSISE